MQRLKEERLKAGLTQKQLADIVETSQETISNLEKGNYQQSNGYYCGLSLRKRLMQALPKLKLKDFIVKE